MKTIVIALGGNAILKKNQSFKDQEKNVEKSLKALLGIIKNNKTIITHGNGPQVGYLLLQQKAPLDILDAETEGQIGYLIQQKLHNYLKNKNVVTLITQVLVDKSDPAFKKPTKFIGPFYTKAQARKIKFPVREDIGRGWRRVVPSPKPIEIIESAEIKRMLESGVIVIAAGGGGIPVIKSKGNLEGVEAVIDKDLASALLASSVKAEELLIVTDIDKVYLNYKKPTQKALKKVTLKEIEKYYKQGHFPSGSMGPKVLAAINFLKSGGKKVIIGNTNYSKGTIITK